MSRLRFDDAERLAKEIVRRCLPAHGLTAVLVRDLVGRFRVVIDDRNQTPALNAALRKDAKRLETQFRQDLPTHVPSKAQCVLHATEMFEPDLVLANPDCVVLESDLVGKRLFLDRVIVGADWARLPPVPQSQSTIRRLAFFGMKGGVGRTTAAVMVARRLAQLNKKVLVLDLDLESPGVTSALLGDGDLPEAGVLDWYVEEAIGQADDEMVRSMVGTSPLDGLGIRVAPAYGRDGRGSYLAKLSRAYLDLSSGGTTLSRGFPARTRRMLARLEELEAPDVLIIDSRAGLHDVAATVITQLDAFSLLFATSATQTWDDFQLLFEGWRQRPEVARVVRRRISVVGAMVPETGGAEYLDRLRDRAHKVFSSTLYDDQSEDDRTAFNFEPQNVEGPHHPVPVYWDRSMLEFDPCRPGASIREQNVQKVYADLFRYCLSLVGIEEAE